MPIVQAPDILFSISAQKRFAPPCEYGHTQYGFTNYGDEFVFLSLRPYGARAYGEVDYGDITQFAGVYAKRRLKTGQGTIRMPYYIPRNPRTTPQQIRRTKFANAVAAYIALTAEQRLVYHRRAVGLRMTGYNVFLKEYMLS